MEHVTAPTRIISTVTIPWTTRATRGAAHLVCCARGANLACGATAFEYILLVRIKSAGTPLSQTW